MEISKKYKIVIPRRGEAITDGSNN